MNQISKISNLGAEAPLVIHVVTALGFGGVERHMEIIADVFCHKYMKHTFVAIGEGGATERKLLALGADVLCLRQKVEIPSPGTTWALLNLFRHERPLAVHTHGAEANFHGLIAAWLAGVPVRVGEEIGIPNHGNKAKQVFRLVYHTAHCVIGISRAVTQWLIASGEVSREKATLIYNPVQLPSLSQHTVSSPDIFRIGFVGRLEAIKNPLALLDAFFVLQAAGAPCELWYIGDGSERVALEESVMNKGLAKKVRLFGYQANPSSLVRQCHIYVQPSLSEGFGLALVEAMGCGVPVIATDVGGAPEFIEHGKTGWLLPQPSPDLIAAALEEALTAGPELLRKMGLRARKSVEDRFDPGVYLERIEALYQSLADQ